MRWLALGFYHVANILEMLEALHQFPVLLIADHDSGRMSALLSDRAPGSIDVGFLGATGMALALSCDRPGAALHPFAKLRTGAHLIEQFLGLPCHTRLRKSALAHGAQSGYTVDQFDGSTYCPGAFGNLQDSGTFQSFSPESPGNHFCP